MQAILDAINDDGDAPWVALGQHIQEVLKDGFWNANDYQRGMANGMLLAAHTLMGLNGVQMQVLRPEEQASSSTEATPVKANSDYAGSEMSKHSESNDPNEDSHGLGGRGVSGPA